jgi:hypothetical protein
MKRSTARTCLLSLLTLSFSAALAQAPASPAFMLSASNSTMPSNGDGGIPIILTSINGFTGTVVVGCGQPTVAAGVTAPVCDYPGPVASTYTLAANATLNKVIGVAPPIDTFPTARLRLPTHGAPHESHREAAAFSLAAALMLGLGLRRRRAHPSTSLLLAVAMLMTLSAMTACAGPKTLTPGTYTYTLVASEYEPSDPATLPPPVTVTATVTVPSGVVIPAPK